MKQSTRSYREQVRGGDALAVVILKLEFRDLLVDWQNVHGQALLLQLNDGPRMNSLRFRGNIFRDQFLALGEDLVYRANLSLRSRLFEGAPLHDVSCSS
jgi:hypothetical protein